MKKVENIDEYILSFSSEMQAKLQLIRETIIKAAPNAIEVISYGMPAFKQKRVLVYFAGYANHIGFYPTATGIKNFENELIDYKWSKGAIQFPNDKPLPLDLITKITKFKVEEDRSKLS